MTDPSRSVNPDRPSRVEVMAITVVGHDRPGIIAETASALAGCGMNLEDSSMTLLRGHFAMTLICAGAAGADTVGDALAPLVARGLSVDVRLLPDEDDGSGPGGRAYLITVHGADRLGIVARLAAVLAEAGGNVTDLTTRLTKDLYVLLAEVDLPAGVDVDQVESRLRAVAAELGVEAALRPVEYDDL